MGCLAATLWHERRVQRHTSVQSRLDTMADGLSDNLSAVADMGMEADEGSAAGLLRRQETDSERHPARSVLHDEPPRHHHGCGMAVVPAANPLFHPTVHGRGRQSVCEAMDRVRNEVSSMFCGQTRSRSACTVGERQTSVGVYPSSAETGQVNLARTTRGARQRQQRPDASQRAAYADDGRGRLLHIPQSTEYLSGEYHV